PPRWEEMGREERPMTARIPTTLRTLLVGAILCLPPAVFWPVGDAGGQPLSPEPLSCPAGVPPGSQLVPGLLENLISSLNTGWTDKAPKEIDPYPWYDVTQPPNPLPSTTLDGVQIPNFCFDHPQADNFCFTKAEGHCSSGHINLKGLQNLKGMAAVQFGGPTQVSAPTQFKNVAAHSDRGPDGSRITDGVFAPEGHDSGDTTYSYLLAHNANDPRSALVIDLGTPVTVCGDPRNGCHSGPVIQADNDDIYQLDYLSNDG